TKTDYITVLDTGPTADFAAVPLTGDELLTVALTDLSTSYDGITSWLWDFGDGQTSTEQSPIHEYAQDGTYTVVLTVNEADGSSDTETKADYVTVSDTGPSASFSATPTSGDEPLTISLTDLSTSYDDITSRLWDFGDGQTSIEQSPTYTYLQDGVYTVSLTVLEADGDSDTETKIDYVTVLDTGPMADFSGIPLTGDEPLTVAFSDLSMSHDNIVSRLWDFGDGNTSTEANPSHTYDQDGTYTVSLTVTEADGDSDTETKTDYITVSDTGPTADFEGTPLSGDEPSTVVFTDLSTSYDGIVTWSWDFGDGQTSTEQNPTHEYTQDSTYTVTLTVNEADGDSDTKTKSDYIMVGDTGPTSDFSAEPVSGDEPLTVVFSSLSTSYDGITSWLWGFGDGQTSTEQNPTYTYVQDGTYTVSLTITEADGDSDTETKADYVTVSDTGPMADFSGTPLSGDEPLTVALTDLSTSYDGITSWLWDFGDGQTSTEQNPAHEYAQDGTYSVSLTITEADGDSDTETKADYIAVSDTGPTVDFSGTPLSGDEPLTVAFSDLSTSYDGITSWLWDFGDGQTSTDQNPTHEYTQDGMYTVILTVTEADGDSDTETTW
ncbi:PKD domain-containing protein, partial [Chloroflexota bacterium]